MNSPRKELRCLLVEDVEDDAMLVLRQLRTSGYDVKWERVETAEAMSAALKRQPWDLVISDYQMPKFSGLAALEIFQKSGLDLPFIIVSGTIGEEVAVAAMRAGAHDYLMKGKLMRLGPAVARELNDAAHRRERHHAEASLAKSNSLLTAALESTADGILVVDLQDKVTTFNRRFLDLWQMPEALATARDDKPILQFAAEQLNDPVAFLAKVRALYNSPAADSKDELELRDGRVLERYSHPQWMEGAIVGRVWSFRDITTRRQAEVNLARLHQQHELILNSTAEGILGVNLEGRHTFVNPAAARMLGYDPAELIGRESHSLWHHTKADGSHYPVEECQILAAYREGQVHHNSTEVFWRKDGSSFPVDYASTPIFEQGRLVGAVVTFEDISERKKAETELREKEEQFRTLFDRASEGIMLLSTDGHAVAVNEAFARMHGYSREEMMGMSLRHMNPPGSDPKIRERFARLMRGSIEKFEVEHFHKDGHIFSLEVSSSLISFGGKSYFQAFHRDITERKQAASRDAEQLAELRRWHEAMLGREDRVIGIKREVNELLARLGEPPRYASAEEVGGRREGSPQR